jgi:hypothetical protein
VADQLTVLRTEELATLRRTFEKQVKRPKQHRLLRLKAGRLDLSPVDMQRNSSHFTTGEFIDSNNVFVSNRFPLPPLPKSIDGPHQVFRALIGARCAKDRVKGLGDCLTRNVPTVSTLPIPACISDTDSIECFVGLGRARSAT